MQSIPQNGPVDMAGTPEQYISPFQLPTDEEVFITRETEAQKRKEAKELSKNLKIWDKKTASSRMPLTKFNEEEIPTQPDPNNLPYNPLNNHRKLINEAKDIVKNRVGVPTDSKQQNIHEFLEQKKEMFLVGMSLNNIKDEIEVYKEKIRRKDIALEESRNQLTADEIKLDQIFTNDKKETAEKQNKAAMKEKLRKQRENELKVLEQQISVLMTENGKHFDTLEYMIKLREFLYKLMPQLKKEGDQVLAREKEAYVRTHMREMQMPGRLGAAGRGTGTFGDHAGGGGGGHHHHHEDEGKSKQEILEEKKEKAGREFDQQFSQGFIEIEELDAIEDRYFQNPDQLNDIFTQLEEKNLILIQHTQEQDQEKEEVKAKYKDLQQKKGRRCQELKNNVRELEREIEQERAKVEELLMKTEMREEMSEQSTFLNKVRTKLIEVFKKIDPNTDFHAKHNLDLLTAIELRVEKFLETLEKHEDDKVRLKERHVVAQRRFNGRIQKKLEEEAKFKQKQEQSLAKLNRPALKKAGKPHMFRSNPPLVKKKEAVEEKNDESLELKKYFE